MFLVPLLTYIMYIIHKNHMECYYLIASNYEISKQQFLNKIQFSVLWDRLFHLNNYGRFKYFLEVI